MNLPKFLVQKIGKDRLHAMAGGYTPTPHTVMSRPRNRACPSHTGKVKARKKWRDIRDGIVQPDPLYSLDEAVDRAGLPDE